MAPLGYLPQVPVAEEPILTVLIPVYNQWQFTATCLASLTAACGRLPTEVILADDGSTDATVTEAQRLTGLRIVRDGVNRGFLRNCNHAARAARGRYLVLLNNDTKCAPGALARLVEVLEGDTTIGAVAPVLLNADGSVQDAGGLVWCDGSAGNLGRYAHPGDPAFRFRRDADYLTGACLALRRELWEMLGGFDEHFIPAYCEDTDLSFRIRGKGLRTVVDPFAKVLHYEGATHGRALHTGLKAHQVTNLARFAERWASVLAKQPLATDTSLRARDRIGNAPIVLVVDRQVPTPDRDAGSVCTLHYLATLRELGCRVTFLGLDGPRYPSVQLLEDLGVEVLAGPNRGGDWATWLRRWGHEIDLAILNRPEPTERILPHLRRVGYRGPWAYVGHDLHFLRFQREATLPGQARADRLLAESQRWFAIEERLHRQADHLLAITMEEAQLIREQFGRESLLFPGFRFGDPTSLSSPAGRDRLLFVGGMSHAPNLDAMSWFLSDVLPRLHDLGLNPPVDIVGANAPAVWAQHPGVTLFGSIDSAGLQARMACARITLLPLRFGAGLKGKLVQSLHAGIPVVGTRVALEGLQSLEKEMLKPVDDPDAMAERILTLYRSDSDWMQAARAASAAGLAFTPKASRLAFHRLLAQSTPQRTWRCEEPR